MLTPLPETSFTFLDAMRGFCLIEKTLNLRGLHFLNRLRQRSTGIAKKTRKGEVEIKKNRVGGEK